MQVRNPRTGEFDYEIAPLDQVAIADEVSRLRSAQLEWGAKTPQQRADIMLLFADAIEGAAAGALIPALTTDTGRSGISKMEVFGAAGHIRRWANMAPEMIANAQRQGEPTSHPTISTSTRLSPYPLVGVISPWNFPMTLALIDAVPALLAGSAVLIKPSEVTPRFIRPLMEAVGTVPDLAAVLSIIEGDGPTGAAMIDQVDFVCFTGSVTTGRKVGEAAARAFIPASLELGGKDPLIVLASADMEQAAATALRGSIVNTGQACQSIERVYVASEIAESFLEKLVSLAQEARLNHPDINKGDIGPFIFARQAEIAQSQIDDAVSQGAKVLAGGKVETLDGGLYLRPTVLTNVREQMAIIAEENFGPVIPVQTFNSIDEAIALANSGEFGLSAAVIAATAEEAESVAARLNVGAVSINDASLTSMVWEAEKSSFGYSGIGPSRMGDSGLMRFFRKKALIRQSGPAARISDFSEEKLS
ncbi:aldehyde dehydrogenase family protein [Alterisphingorhabdus coralli]|uniref:Aldehyde dehydrogenase family protein n=1 Tax=Alterisphingorhabdus coralli TaxID=3071408 RepID=A0AA97F8C0_9SPHN|nr:aldehyde dehydrogenase family protein [Parasphingorhabdus sp. SCSIO 66989]WOE75366.1 aldehyde dehydrogenase family protein [Parasphingorhabdus sp. SCSIO 66989]